MGRPRHRLGVLPGALALGLAGASVSAQEAGKPAGGAAESRPAPEVTRVELGRAPVSGVEGKEMVVQLVEIPPGATSRRHFHNGEEAYYVLDGGSVQSPGKAPTQRPAGEHGINARGVPHAGYTNVGDRPLRILSVYVVDTGKPLQVPVP